MILQRQLSICTIKVGAILDIKKEKHNLQQHDVRIGFGSTLPTNKYAELGVYMEAFRMGIVDRTEVLKKNPEIFDKEGVMRRTEEKDSYYKDRLLQ